MRRACSGDRRVGDIKLQFYRSKSIHRFGLTAEERSSLRALFFDEQSASRQGMSESIEGRAELVSLEARAQEAIVSAGSAMEASKDDIPVPRGEADS